MKKKEHDIARPQRFYNLPNQYCGGVAAWLLYIVIYILMWAERMSASVLY